MRDRMCDAGSMQRLHVAAACLAAAVGVGPGACSSAADPAATFVSELSAGLPALLEKSDTPGAAVVLVNRDEAVDEA